MGEGHKVSPRFVLALPLSGVWDLFPWEGRSAQVGQVLFLLCKSENIRLELCLLSAKNGMGEGWGDLRLGKFSLAWGQWVSYTGAGTGSTVFSPVQQAGSVAQGAHASCFLVCF